MEPEMYIHMPSETPEHMNVFGHMGGGGWCGYEENRELARIWESYLKQLEKIIGPVWSDSLWSLLLITSDVKSLVSLIILQWDPQI